MPKDPNNMSFLEHLEELRWRLIKIVLAISAGATVAFIYKSFVFDVVIFGPKNPDFFTYRFLCWMGNSIGMGDVLCLSVNFELQNIAMSGQFTSHIVVSLVAGLILTFPYVFYQIWRFIAPGLRSGEKKTANSVVFACTFLFVLGLLFGYYLIAPLSVQFLGNYTVSEQVANQVTLSSYISTVTMVTISCGLVFQLPMAVYFMAKMGLVTHTMLKQYRKHAFIVVLILSAIITPPDITSQILVALPLMVLYEISIVIARIVTKKNGLKN